MARQKKQNLEIATWARELWEKAMESERGLEIEYEDNTSAQRARFALYTARNNDRELSLELHSEGDPMRGKSLWDPFRVIIVGATKSILRIEQHSAELVSPMNIREL